MSLFESVSRIILYFNKEFQSAWHDCVQGWSDAGTRCVFMSRFPNLSTESQEGRGMEREALE
eukprot:5456996-Amphidinium_carterae.1